MRGAVYVAYGSPAIDCLGKAVQALAVYEPQLPVVVISDQQVDGLATVLIKTKDPGARSVKTQLPYLVPQDWRNILYMDVDTLVQKNMNRLFKPLEVGWDIVMCQDELAWTVAECRLKRPRETQGTKAEYGTGDLAQFAGGVFAWSRNKRTDAFFSIWHKEWTRWRHRDQGALVRALAQVPLKLWPLSARINASDKASTIEVWHQHGKARRANSP